MQRAAPDDDEYLVYLLDYGAGNVLSVTNAIISLGYRVKVLESPEELRNLHVSSKLIFPGVGNFFLAGKFLKETGFGEALKEYIKANKFFLGICIGMQCLFEGSDESSEYPGLGIIPGQVKNFRNCEGFSNQLSVPHIGWNTMKLCQPSLLFEDVLPENRVYFVHSFCAEPTELNKEWVVSQTFHGVPFISSVGKGNVYATQFHPEKSSKVGLLMLKSFLSLTKKTKVFALNQLRSISLELKPQGLSKRIIACMDVQRDEKGEIVVTKGVGYNVVSEETNKIRNYGSPVTRAKEYYKQSCDELVFLGITTYKEGVLDDSTLHEVLRNVSKEVFVPLTIGGGIRNYKDKATGREIRAVEIAEKYFRSGADKVGIGSDAVRAVQEYIKNNKVKTGKTSIEEISKRYGKQAVVLSVDPKRLYLDTEEEIEAQRKLGKHIFEVKDYRSSNKYDTCKCVYLATTSGGKTQTDLCVLDLVKGAEELGAGEVLLNCIDTDGRGTGYDLDLVKKISEYSGLPVIASGGAGELSHFADVFRKTTASAVLASSILHKGTMTIRQIKEDLKTKDIPVR